MLQIAGGREDHVPAQEAAFVIAEELVLIELAHRGGGAQNGLAQWMILPEVLGEELVHQHVGIVFVDLDLFENHAALALNVARGKGRVEHQV